MKALPVLPTICCAPAAPLLSEPEAEELAARFKALADPTRVAIVNRLSAADEVGYPVVLKALAQEHKSDAGGVAVGISGAEELESQLSRMATLAAEYSIERMAPVEEGVELIVGTRRDPRFGPVTLVGMGGLYTEVLDDKGVALAPVDEASAEERIRALRGAPLLEGARGRPPLDVKAAAGAVAALSRLAAAHPEFRRYRLPSATTDNARVHTAVECVAPAIVSWPGAFEALCERARRDGRHARHLVADRRLPLRWRPLRPLENPPFASATCPAPPTRSTPSSTDRRASRRDRARPNRSTRQAARPMDRPAPHP